MQTQRDRLTTILNGEIGKLKLKDKATGEASGPQLVYAPDQSGQMGFVLGWQFTIWLEHNMLLGQDPIGVSVPVGMMLPPESLVRQAAAFLLEEARKQRDKANAPTLEPMAALNEAQQDNPDMQAFLANMRNDA